jgi:hypothetical protein
MNTMIWKGFINIDSTGLMMIMMMMMMTKTMTAMMMVKLMLLIITVPSVRKVCQATCPSRTTFTQKPQFLLVIIRFSLQLPQISCTALFP